MAAISRSARSGKFPVWRWVILLVAGVYFLLPLYAALRFAGIKRQGRLELLFSLQVALLAKIVLGLKRKRLPVVRLMS